MVAAERMQAADRLAQPTDAQPLLRIAEAEL